MKKLLILLAAIVLLCSVTLPAGAVTADFETLDYSRDIVITVTWPTEQPTVTFIAPDGEVYDPMQEREDTMTVVSPESIYYLIYSAQAGTWQVDYDKKGNETINISMFDYHPSLNITDLTLGSESGGALPIKFTVTSDEGQWYDYTVSLVTEKGSQDEIYLTSGRAMANEEFSVDLSMDWIRSGTYYIRLYVAYTDGETDFFDYVYSDAFEHTGSVESPLADFELTAVPEDYLINVAWPDDAYGVEKVMVAVFENGESEPSFFDEYDYYDGQVQLSYDPGDTEVAVEVSAYTGDIYAPTLRKGFVPSDFIFSMDDTRAVNTLNPTISYRGAENYELSVSVGGGAYTTVIDGDGGINLNLSDGWNDVSASYKDTDGVTWLLERRIYVDRDAPVLTMADDYDGAVTRDDSVLIAGSVSQGGALTVNGKTVSQDTGGVFSTSVDLVPGDNTITVVASDDVGNEAVYTAVIRRSTGGADENSVSPDAERGSFFERVRDGLLAEKGWLWMAISGAIALLVIVYALIFWRGGRKER